MMKYVAACEHGCWHLMLHPPGERSKVRPVPFRCRSWRHPGKCCEWKGAQDFVRVQEAIEKRDDWVYVVLTFAQSEWWDWRAQYRLAFPMWKIMHKRLIREYGKLQYVQTWERHRKQGIHVNLLIGNPAVHLACESDAKEWQEDVLVPMCLDIGFGNRTHAECLRGGSHASMAGYLTKLARELVGAGVKNQIPWDAPPHFRRLRASRGLLPPVYKSDMTGWLSFTPFPGEQKKRNKGGV